MTENSNYTYARELARGTAGAVLFAFPLLMTMEMWSLGFSISRDRLLIFIIIGLALLCGLSHYAGFRHTDRLRDTIMDAGTAFAIGIVVGATLLTLFGVLDKDMPIEEILGKVAIQAIPGGIGAILANKQLQLKDDPEADQDFNKPTFFSELFLMFGGAVFIALNVAPTDEIAIIAHMITPWHALILAVLSIVSLHALVYSVEFSGQEDWPESHSFVKVFYRFSLTGYGIALAVSLYILWTFGRTDDLSLGSLVLMAVVLGFPASLGAATARLII